MLSVIGVHPGAKFFSKFGDLLAKILIANQKLHQSFPLEHSIYLAMKSLAHFDGGGDLASLHFRLTLLELQV